jgi:hypothetical protein
MEFRIRQINGYLRYVGNVQLVCSQFKKRPNGRLGSDFLKIFDENPAVISQKGFENVGFDEIQVCPIRGRFFGGARTFFNKL